jgi:hypothetical protein
LSVISTVAVRMSFCSVALAAASFAAPNAAKSAMEVTSSVMIAIIVFL